MKKILLIAISAAALSAYGLPTYEPFTEYANLITASPSNSISLCTYGCVAPSGEPWLNLNFSGTAGTGLPGYNVQVMNNTATAFTTSALASLLPSGFPGLWGTNIQIAAYIPTQPSSVNVVGNSTVLQFSQHIPRPTSGIKTIYVSYLLDITAKGGTGTGNNGRYCGFLASTNLVEGTNTAGAYQSWASLFNTFPGPTYISYGLKQDSTIGDYIGPSDSSGGNNGAVSTLAYTPYNSAAFVVGAYVFTTGGSLADTNILWLNPPTTSFGGPTPPATSLAAYTMGVVMSDVGGFFLEGHVGSGSTGGIGPMYIGNLLIGTTWSYVTGGPEFTNQPPAITSVPLGGTASITGLATAAGQSVTYQWYNITSGSNAVNGANSSTLTFPNFSSGDVGNYVLVATANGTGFTLNSTTATLRLSDPEITASPANATANYGQSAHFTATATTADAPLTYGWWLNGTPLTNGLQADGQTTVSGARGTTSGSSPFTLTLTLNNVPYQDIGSYTLYVTNTGAFNNSSVPATLAVNDPYVFTPPANPAVVAGGTATFTVVASGSPTVSYQWYEGATALVDNGATATGSAIVSGSQTATLTLSPVSDADDGSYYCAITSSASGQNTNSPAATLTVQDALSIVSPPMSLTERAGDHVAFVAVVAGGGPQFQWSFSGTPILGATSSTLVLTNIQPANAGSYSVTITNLVTTTPQIASATLTVINGPILPLWPTNLVVARVGDGAQTLSGATGNTLYLDQYSPAGTYVSSIQVPDEATGQPYGTGSSSSSSMPFGSPALLVAGSNVSPGNDAGYEAFLSLSTNGQTLSFGGYCLAYPFSGPDVSAEPGGNGGNTWRGVGAVDAYGYYTLCFTNTRLYSEGNHQLHSAVDIDGNGTNFYATGVAGSGPGVRYCNIASTTLGQIAGSYPGTRVAQIIAGNLVFSDASAVPSGIYVCLGLPTTAASAGLLLAEPSSPMDFAASPDLQTLYVADNSGFGGTGVQAGGIQRWDANGTSPYNGFPTYGYSYTLGTGTGSTVGARGLTVDFSATGTWGAGVTGAKLYATTAEPAGNRLIKIVDNGATSSATLLAAAGPSQVLAGVRFGPAVVAPSFSGQLQNQTASAGSNVTFTAGALGSGPLAYQWYFQAGGTGPFVAILNATNATYTIAAAGSGNVGNYYVVVTNPGLLTAQSPTVSLSLILPAQFISETYLGPGNGIQLNFTGPSGQGYRIWTTTDVTLSPVESTWTYLANGNFSGGTDAFTDTSYAPTSPQQFYIMTVP